MFILLTPSVILEQDRPTGPSGEKNTSTYKETKPDKKLSVKDNLTPNSNHLLAKEYKQVKKKIDLDLLKGLR